MRSPTIRIVDFSSGTDFHQSLAATRSLISATAATYEWCDDEHYVPSEPLAHIESVVSDQPDILTAALHAETLVLHLASHMHGRGEGEPGFHGRDGEITVAEVASWLKSGAKASTQTASMSTAATVARASSSVP